MTDADKHQGPADMSRLHSEIWDASIGPGLDESYRLFDRRRNEVPEHLLHFTSAEALVSIIRTQTLRLCRARSSNDPAELDHGLSLARAEQGTRIQNRGDEIFRDELFNSFDGRLGDETERRTLDPHVCCFTEDDNANAVAHWAMYGRDGSGFALRFKGRALAALKDVNLSQINYDEGEQRAYLRELLTIGRTTSQKAAEYAQGRYGGVWAERSFRIAAHAFGGIVSLHAATMKAPAFEAEREWRLIHPGVAPAPDEAEAAAPLTAVEARGPILRTYFEVPFERDDLVSVVVGPVHANLNRPIVKRMLEERGYAGTQVETGKVALRVLRDGL